MDDWGPLVTLFTEHSAAFAPIFGAVAYGLTWVYVRLGGRLSAPFGKTQKIVGAVVLGLSVAGVEQITTEHAINVGRLVPVGIAYWLMATGIHEKVKDSVVKTAEEDGADEHMG